MGLNYKQTDDEGQVTTSFTLAKGTTLPLGSETVTLKADTVVSIPKDLSHDAIVETIIGAGQAGVNSDNFAHVDGEVSVTYGGRGQRIETPAPKKEAKPEPRAKPEPKTKPAPKKK